jgi:hypothetical protein
MRDERLTALDGIAVLLTGLLTAILAAFPFLVAPSFARMFRDFGGAALPVLTRLVLSQWFPLTLAATTAVGPVLACIPKVPLRARRWALVAAFAFGCAAVGVCWTGLYQPIFALAGKIKD